MYIYAGENQNLNSWLRKIYEKISIDLNTEFDATINFVPNIEEYNRKYRSKDSSTDVLSFNVTDPTNKYFIGDLVLSIKDITDNAGEFNEDFHEELLRCIVHGTLHLLGHDHQDHLLPKKNEQKEEMFIIQEKILGEILNGNSLQKIQKQDI